MSNHSDGREQAFSREDRAQFTRLISEVKVINDNIAQIAVALDQLTQATLKLRDQAAATEAQLAGFRPQFEAMKVHTDSFPHALREARRFDVANQKMIQDLLARVREIELRMGIAAPASETDAGMKAGLREEPVVSSTNGSA